MAYNLFRREVTGQFIRFCFIGLESTVLNYLVFLILLNFFFVFYLISAAAGFLAGMFFGFTFNKIYTFRSRRKSVISLPVYFLVYLFTLGFNLIALKLLVGFAGLQPLISNAVLIPISTLMNFFGTKIIALQNKKW